MYRARPDRTLQHQRVRLDVGQGSSMEWLPLETILYPNARTRLDLDVELAADARFIGWEVTSLGLPAQGKVLKMVSYSSACRYVAKGDWCCVSSCCWTSRARRCSVARQDCRDSRLQG